MTDYQPPHLEDVPPAEADDTPKPDPLRLSLIHISEPTRPY